MIVAFTKNELKDGTKRKLSEYSNDLETRIEENIGVDFVLETGTSGGYRYRKWNNGDIEFWQSWDFTNMASDSVPITIDIPISGCNNFKVFHEAFATNKNNATIDVNSYVHARPHEIFSWYSTKPTLYTKGAFTGGSGSTSRLNVVVYIQARWK